MDISCKGRQHTSIIGIHNWLKELKPLTHILQECCIISLVLPSQTRIVPLVLLGLLLNSFGYRLAIYIINHNKLSNKNAKVKCHLPRHLLQTLLLHRLVQKKK